MTPHQEKEKEMTDIDKVREILEFYRDAGLLAFEDDNGKRAKEALTILPAAPVKHWDVGKSPSWVVESDVTTSEQAIRSQQRLARLKAVREHSEELKSLEAALDLLWDNLKPLPEILSYEEEDTVKALDKAYEKIKCAITAAQQRPEVVTVGDLAQRLTEESRAPHEATVVLDSLQKGYWVTRLEILAKMFPHGLIIKSGEG